jgi:hypothetical protein
VGVGDPLGSRYLGPIPAVGDRFAIGDTSHGSTSFSSGFSRQDENHCGAVV